MNDPDETESAIGSVIFMIVTVISDSQAATKFRITIFAGGKGIPRINLI